ncbi:MAG: tRNA pseudouridine(55) synthase TruB [Holosporales bacterium]|jgi:tRNA pseudouridine55 synthase|nr:tRNA pseudouridine(55) synthase TruB [Holosporales bacterium]
MAITETSLISGFMVIDKPAGISSATVDRICKYVVRASKVGHIGTLDPFATGVLVLAINDATKVIQYIGTRAKSYEFTVKFGERTSTGDITGDIIEKCGYVPSMCDVSGILKRYTGEISQTPHMFSAVKINGKRAYKLARSGVIPRLAPKIIKIHGLTIREQLSKTEFVFEATVSSGTYIRSLCEDLAKTVNTLAHVTALRRVKDGQFSIKDAISLDKLREKADSVGSVLIPLENVLDGIPVVLLSCQNAENLAFGRTVTVDLNLQNGTYIAKADCGFLGIVEYGDGVIRPKRLIKMR